MIRAAFSLLLVAALAFPGAALAEAGGKPGKGKPDKEQSTPRSNDSGKARDGSSPGVMIQFTDSDRRTVADYFAPQINSGNCPPGLAKKHNGCQPPGQAKKWQIGRRLPGDVIFYAVPGALLARLPMPPEGQKYVRVASDILLIAAGTGLVMAAIEDLGRIQ